MLRNCECNLLYDILLKNTNVFSVGELYGRKIKASHEDWNFNRIREEGLYYVDKTEDFYHNILLGLFGNMGDWKVKSNAESGDGGSAISVEVEDREIGIIIELKYPEVAAFDDACKEALKQIHDRNYEETLLDDGMKTIYRYGIACYKKRWRVISE